VTLTSDPHENTVRVGIRWQSGAAEEHTIQRPPGVIRRTPPEALELLRRLGPHHSNAEIAIELNTAGLRTGTGRPFDATAVSQLRSDHGIAPQPLTRDDELTVNQIAQRVGISRGSVYYWIRHGQLAARPGHGRRLCVPFPPEVEQQCRERIATSIHLPDQTKITLTGGAV
jgi:excisionase family DNA binding protein